MSTIRCVYSRAPNFPADDQHPDAVRYTVGAHIVDAIGGEPTAEEVAAYLAPTAEQVADAAALDAAKADATIAYLVSHTPAECYAKVQTDVTDLASAKVMLGRLAMAVSVIARQHLR